MKMVYHADDLLLFTTELLAAAGLPQERALVVAEILLEGDLLGHTTHGLQLLSPYLKSIEAGRMKLNGEPEVISDRGSAIVWDGHYLPGPWLTLQAIELAQSRVHQHGVVTVVIRRSHHIGCLQAYLKKATDAGQILILMSSDPATASVAPHGGLTALYTPNPIAAGIPTDGDPILIDISTSSTSNGLAMRQHKRGEPLPHPWLKDAHGGITNDPAALFSEPPGTILPLGGIESGHKGFALGILVEALTSGLAGYGRADSPNGWGASVFLQIIDPNAFGGSGLLAREMNWFAKASRQTPVASDDPPVRMPGENALKRREFQLKEGVELFPGIMASLLSWAEKFDIGSPEPHEPE
jgi:LDH2 family malate/lactate/ureidoglycolate dehydrogenase